MRFLKKLLCICVLGCLALGIGFGTSALLTDDKSSAAVVSAETFQYITLSRNEQTLDETNLKTVDETTYIIANDSLTMTFKPLEYSYEFSIDETYFEIDPETINISYNTETSNFPETFELDGKTYYYRINESSAILNIYENSPVTGSAPIATTNRNNAITYTYTPESLISITIIKSITLKSNTSNVDFTFSVNTSGAVKTYTMAFLRPVVQFANAQKHIVRFTCNGLDAGTSEYVDNLIPSELNYNTVQMDFLHNEYSEFNPLYFVINYNGFVYTFELYSKEYNSVNYLFVNYIDEVNTNNNQYLATGLQLNQDNELEPDPNHLINAFINGSDTNEFSLLFTETGRYSIEIYDATYLYGFKNPNYIQTSFYITDNTKSNFENIYIIAQTQEDDGTDIEYIVSTSTLNHSVKTTIKNLADFADVGGNPVTLADVIEKIEIKKTTFGGSTNIPTITTYLPEDLDDMIVDGDLEISFDSDAYYEINIYQKDTSQTIYYEFTIVKHAKTTFTVPLVDENGEPIYDINTGKQKTDTYEATVPYRTEIITYTKNILSSMNLNVKFTSSGDVVQAKNIGKTYTNVYTISYGVQAVILEQYELIVKDGSEETVVPGLHLRVYGVGDITLSVTYNGVTTDYILNSEVGNNTISFTEYGSYTVRMVDSMGTQTAGVYKYSKKLNTSAMALIILASIIVVAVLAFVFISRGKLKTR